MDISDLLLPTFTPICPQQDSAILRLTEIFMNFPKGRSVHLVTRDSKYSKKVWSFVKGNICDSGGVSP